jgi:hypothetical protein
VRTILQKWIFALVIDKNSFSTKFSVHTISLVHGRSPSSCSPFNRLSKVTGLPCSIIALVNAPSPIPEEPLVHGEQGRVLPARSAKRVWFARCLLEVLYLIRCHVVHRHNHRVIFHFCWGTTCAWLLRLVTLLKMVHNNAPQLPLPLVTYTKEKKHPSNGGNPYSDDFRNIVITRFLSNLPLDLRELMIMHQQYAYPCFETCKRYVS